MLTRGSKDPYDRHDNDSTVKEAPFIRTRQPHPGGASQDWHGALVSHPKYHTLAISKINCHTHADITSLPCPWTSLSFTKEVQSDSLETWSCTPCAFVMHWLGNMRNSLTIVLLLYCHSWWFFHSPAPMNLLCKTSSLVHFTCQHPALFPLMVQTRIY